jgi:hypothetical protein
MQKETVLHGVFSVPGMFCAILRGCRTSLWKSWRRVARACHAYRPGARFARNLFGRVPDLGVSLLHAGGAIAVDNGLIFRLKLRKTTRNQRLAHCWGGGAGRRRNVTRLSLVKTSAATFADMAHVPEE